MDNALTVNELLKNIDYKWSKHFTILEEKNTLKIITLNLQKKVHESNSFSNNLGKKM